MLDLIVISILQATAAQQTPLKGTPSAAAPTVEVMLEPSLDAAEARANRAFCRTSRVTGSRLRTERICTTDRRVIEERRAFQQNTERAANTLTPN